MLEEFLSKNEGKTLEFKENTQSLQKIVQTIIAFANTAGGVLLLGIKNETKEIVGLSNILLEEERIDRTLGIRAEENDRFMSSPKHSFT